VAVERAVADTRRKLVCLNQNVKGKEKIVDEISGRRSLSLGWSGNVSNSFFDA